MKEYGLLYYDIPANNMKLYAKVKRIVFRRCLPVNLSVYMFDWGLKKDIEGQLTKINAFNQANINMIKFDNTSSEQLENIGTDQLNKLLTGMHERLKETVAKLHDTEKRENYLDRLSSKLKHLEGLLVLYSFARSAEPSLKVLKQALTEEYKILGL